MKKYIISLLLFLSLGGSIWGQTTCLSEIDVSNRQIEKTPDKQVAVKIGFDLTQLDIKRQHSLVMIPILLSSDGVYEQTLPAVIVNGRVRDKVNSRMEALDKSSLYPEEATVVRRDNGITQVVDYETEVPFKRWMIGGELLIRGYVVGCAACGEGSEVADVGAILPAMEAPVYSFSFIAPQEEMIKYRSETRSARLQFRQNSSVIEPTYRENRSELDSVRTSISLVKDNSDLSITGIYVTGFASPEGSYVYNMNLSERRAKAFAEYMKDDLKGINPELYHVAWKGEDWEGLRVEVLKHPQLERISDVLAIIDHCGNDKDVCEEKLKALQPSDIYRRLLNEMYPMVRRNEYRIEYNVRHFNLEEGRQMINSHPELMSVSEIQKVADSYGKGSKQYLDCMLRGAKAYPKDVVMQNNVALALIEAECIADAILLLKQAPRDARLINLLGVAYAKSGNVRNAEKEFSQAATLGCTEARNNLRLLQAYTEYMME